MSSVSIEKDLIAEFCRQHRIKKLSLFGSVLTDRFSLESDVDVLVEFEPDYRIGLIGFADIELKLARMLGRRVDLRTPKDLSPYFRDDVLAQAVVQYDH